jgi:hypothetical protein
MEGDALRIPGGGAEEEIAGLFAVLPFAGEREEEGAVAHRAVVVAAETAEGLVVAEALLGFRRQFVIRRLGGHLEFQAAIGGAAQTLERGAARGAERGADRGQRGLGKQQPRVFAGHAREKFGRGDEGEGGRTGRDFELLRGPRRAHHAGGIEGVDLEGIRPGGQHAIRAVHRIRLPRRLVHDPALLVADAQDVGDASGVARAPPRETRRRDVEPFARPGFVETGPRRHLGREGDGRVGGGFLGAAGPGCGGGGGQGSGGQQARQPQRARSGHFSRSMVQGGHAASSHRPGDRVNGQGPQRAAPGLPRPCPV